MFFPLDFKVWLLLFFSHQVQTTANSSSWVFTFCCLFLLYFSFCFLSPYPSSFVCFFWLVSLSFSLSFCLCVCDGIQVKARFGVWLILSWHSTHRSTTNEWRTWWNQRKEEKERAWRVRSFNNDKNKWQLGLNSEANQPNQPATVSEWRQTVPKTNWARDVTHLDSSFPDRLRKGTENEKKTNKTKMAKN